MIKLDESKLPAVISMQIVGCEWISYITGYSLVKEINKVAKRQNRSFDFSAYQGQELLNKISEFLEPKLPSTFKAFC